MHLKKTQFRKEMKIREARSRRPACGSQARNKSREASLAAGRQESKERLDFFASPFLCESAAADRIRSFAREKNSTPILF